MSAWLRVQCPKCGVPAGDLCDRNSRFGGGKDKRRNPHSQRRQLARQVTGRDFESQQPVAKTIDLMQALKQSLGLEPQS